MKGSYHIWAWLPSWSCNQHHVIGSTFPCIQKLTYKIWLKMAQWFLRKASFQFSYVNDLGSRSKNDFDLEYSHNFINSISCLHLPTFRSQSEIVSEKSTALTFSYRKAFLQDLAIKLISKGSSLEETTMGWSLRCYIPNFVVISTSVPGKKIFEAFLLYMGMTVILVM